MEKKKGRSDSGENVDFQLVARFSKFRVNMMTREKQLIEVTIGGLAVDTTVRPSNVVFHAGLAEFWAINPTSKGALYREIASVVGGQALHVDVTIFKAATDNENYVNMDAVDLEVHIKMSRLKAVYLSCFVRDLLAFINHFQAAKKAIIEASYAAAVATKQNVQRAFAQSSRVRLNIECQAPYIIVPQTYSSRDALILDLGHLSIKNRFELRSVRNEIESPAIMDSIDLNLEEFRIYLAVVQDEMNIQLRRELISPLTANVTVLRNLSTHWYTDEPDLSVDAQLGKVSITLTEDVYKKAMDIAFDLWYECQDIVGLGSAQSTEKEGNALAVESTTTENLLLSSQSKQEEAAQPTNAQSVDPASTKKLLLSSKSSYLSTDTSLQPNAPPHRVSIRFGATLAEIEVELLVNVPRKTVEQPLSRLAIVGFNVTGDLRSDSSIQSDMTLQSFLIEDTRPLLQTYSSFSSGSTPTSPTMSMPKSSSLKRVIERPISRLLYLTESDVPEQTETKRMLTVNFEKGKEGDIKVDVHLRGFTLILCPNYLLRVVNFFTAGLPSTAPRGPISSISLMTVVVKVEQPEIFLVERIDTLNTLALVLNMEMELSMKIPLQELLNNPLKEMFNEITDITVKLSKLQVFSCLFDPAARLGTKATVLSPCELTITRVGSSRMDVKITDVTLCVSPGTIEMIANVRKSITITEEDDVLEDSDEEEQPVAVWSDLWNLKPLDSLQLPFLNTEPAVKALQVNSRDQLGVEKMKLVFERFTIIIETGQGNRTLPVVLLESEMSAEISNWSSDLEVRASLSLQAAYRNIPQSRWEPLLEPVDCTRSQSNVQSIRQRSWELTMRLKKTVTSERENYSPKIEIAFESADNMELTITRSFLDVVSTLGTAFSDAVKQQLSKRDHPAALYVVHNELDKTVVLDLVNGDFIVDDPSASNPKEVTLKPYETIGLKVKPHIRAHSVLSEQEEGNERELKVKIPQLSCSHSIPVSCSSRRYLPAGQRTNKYEEEIGVVADICNDLRSRSITFRGVVQIRNHFQKSVDVYYMTNTALKKVGRVEGGGVLNVPMYALYTPTGELFFSTDGYDVSTTPFVWRDIQKLRTVSKLLVCSAHQSLSSMSSSDPFFMQATGNVERIFTEDTRKKLFKSECYVIHLRPTVILYNTLPLPLNVLTSGTTNEVQVPPGGSTFLSSAELGSSSVVLKLKNYMDRDWNCKEEIRPFPQELAVWTFISYVGSAKGNLHLGVFSVNKDHTLHMTVYCPFWMINNTGMLLTYKDDEGNCLYHPADMTGPVLFSFEPKSFFEKKAAVIRVADSNWSDRLSLDAAGSSRLVTCKADGDAGVMSYQLGMTVQLSHHGLTKQVIFTPYHIFSNLAPYDIEVCEVMETGFGDVSDTAYINWVQVISGQSVPFWPIDPQCNKSVAFRVGGTTEETLVLSLDTAKPTMLQLENGYGGIFVNFQVSESSVVIVCHPYEEGRAPILLVNHTVNPVFVSESSHESALLTNFSLPRKDVKKIPGMHACFYTWWIPDGSRRLTWGSWGGRKEVECQDVLQNGTGSFQSIDGKPIEWISFLHGRQRVLLFTTNDPLATNLRSVYNASKPIEQRVTLSLPGLGVSLVDNIRRREILYAGITSSGVIWEKAKMGKSRKNFRAIKTRLNILLEEAYQEYCTTISTDETTSSRGLLDEGKFEVDFKGLTIINLKKKKTKHLRRLSSRPGVELVYENYCNRRVMNARLNNLQIDNQMEACVFRTILAPVPPPPSMAAETIPRPFAEISIVELLGAHQQADVPQYEYFKLLVQECHIRADMTLFNAVVTLFVNENDVKSEQERQKSFDLDVASAKQGLHERAFLPKTKDPENYFTMLHLSPLKVHLSFSPIGLEASNIPITSQLLSSFLQSVGVTLKDVQDAVFRLGYFERSDVFLSWSQLARDLNKHYTGQAVNQIYVVFIGEDVFRDPSRLIPQGFKQLFYEPYLGFIQGPGEFAEGLALGTSSFLRHTVGGLAGFASKFTATLGKGISCLTLDEEYQRSRREAHLRRSSSISENLAQGAKAVLAGVVEGVSGVVMRPIEGAQRKGVGGLFTGLGKGAVGLVARPTIAIADFATGALDAVKKAADVNKELPRLRLPRFLHPDGIVRPYLHEEAYGNTLLQALDRGRFSKTDHYVDHAITDGKSTLLVTDRRLLLVSQDVFGQWQVNHDYHLENLTETPQLNPQGLYVPLRRKKVLGGFTTSKRK